MLGGPRAAWFALGVQLLLLLAGFTSAYAAKASKASGLPSVASDQPVSITADRLQYDRTTDTYEADGSVVIVQGTRKLTADRVTLRMLSGLALAKGNAHLKDGRTDLWAEDLELNLNTNAGVVMNGKLFLPDSNTLITGRLLQRFSEDHFRVKNGSFTNCDAKDGQIPPWRFTFKDVDINIGDQLFANSVWFCVNDHPVIPIPTFSYPIQTDRKTGFLVPEDGYDSRFGLHLRQGYFWAINPSHDLTVTPDILTNRGYGGDIQYRYALDKYTKGQWLVTFIEDTVENKGRAVLTGSHTQQVNPDLSIRSQINLLSDSTYYNDLSNSGVLRALPSQESYLNINQKVSHGNLYFTGQYLQPLGVGGSQTFQRLPEIGHQFTGWSPLGGPMLLGGETTGVEFFRESGVGHQRIDFTPSISTDTLHLGHVVGFTPTLKLRETYWTRSVSGGTVDSPEGTHREIFWLGLEGNSRLSRRFDLGEGRTLLHTLEPSIVYEYVPGVKPVNNIQVDEVDYLPKKNLVTYMLRSRMLEHGGKGASNSWLDFTIAQSWHAGAPPTSTFGFIQAGQPNYSTFVQPLEFPQVGVVTKKFSDIWTRAVFGNPVGFMVSRQETKLTVDSFFDPYKGQFSQFNTDLRIQEENRWYVDVGQRWTNTGNRPRRGDIWNPMSFNQVFAPTPEINFATIAGGVHLPLGWTVGGRTYYDFRSGASPETDFVALYQNPCKCWSAGFYLLKFPDRQNYNFMVSLTGLGATESFGTQVMKTILSPILFGEKAVPWPTPTVKLPPQPPAQGAPSGGMTP